jgi:hypothetical protein
MLQPKPAPRRLDAPTLEMIVVVMLTTLHDFLLSDVLSLPLALRRGPLAQLRALDAVASGLELAVPIIVFVLMLGLWLLGRNAWVRRVAVLFLAWVTLRLVFKVTLVLSTLAPAASAGVIVSRPQNGAGPLLRDTVVLWFVIFLLFGVWYWVIDGGGPDARRDAAAADAPGRAQRFDFQFPQRAAALPGWADWRPGLWDYLFLGFSGSTQFGLSDTAVLSVRAKLLLMLQVTLSIAVIVFIASIATGLIR